MKKIFSIKKTIGLVLISLLIVLAFSVSAFAAVEIFKQSDSTPEGDEYAAYYDGSKGKIMERVLEVDSQKTTLKYVRTENLKENPVSKRADSYGTYDVYADDSQTEYLYLLNTDIYCGFKLSNVGVATEKEKAISQEDALEVTNKFLKANRDNYRDYKLISCEYSELAGYYDIQYYLPISGYKSDDIIRVWVDAQGKVTSFSEFNHKRYDRVKIDPEKYSRADKKLEKTIATQTHKTNSNFNIVDSYISIDDSGNVILVKVIDLKIPDDETFVVRREQYVQLIK